MKNKNTFVIGIIICVLLYLALLLWRGVRDSVLFSPNERINIVLYGVEPVLISFGLTDKVNYLIRFDNSLKTYVPGGYGQYGIGGLSKLGQLERDPDLLRRTFSFSTSATIDYYLYPKSSTVYHDSDYTRGFSPTKSALIQALFSSRVASNARFLDTVYLFVTILKQRKIDYVTLRTNFVTKSTQGDEFASDEFFREYQGFFYKKSLRNLDSSVQILYKSEVRAAAHIARILDGEGVRVSDIDIQSDDDRVHKKCIIRYSSHEARVQHNATEDAVRKLLLHPCVVEEGSDANRNFADGFDMVIVLNPALEDVWR